jgi:hypothetical protein
MIRNWLTAVDPEIDWHPERSSDAARAIAEIRARTGSVNLQEPPENLASMGLESHRILEIRSQTTPAICIPCFAMGS